MTHDRITLGFYVGCLELLVAGLGWSYRNPQNAIAMIHWKVFAKLIGAVILGFVAAIVLSYGVGLLIAGIGMLLR